MVTEIKVDGMHCQHCAARVKKASEGIANVTEVVVDLDGKKASITHDNANLNDIVKAINELGFSATL